MSIEEHKDSILNIIHDNTDLNFTPDETISVRMGNKVLKFEVVETETTITDEIELEIKKKYQDKLSEIQKYISEKYSEMEEAFDYYKNEYDQKEKELNKKLKESNIMPDITTDHANQGLSVVKGSNGNLVWLYRGIYWPKYVDEKPIDPKYSKKMITPIIIIIETDEYNVVSVKTRTFVDMIQFEHYHRYGGGDCWGSWNPSTETWKTIDDIIEIGKRAIGILENINSLSLGTRSPKGLPRFNTLEKHLTSDSSLEYNVSKNNERLGDIQNEETTNSVDNMWTT